MESDFVQNPALHKISHETVHALIMAYSWSSFPTAETAPLANTNAQLMLSVTRIQADM